MVSKEVETIEQVKKHLVEIGYSLSVIDTEVRTLYGQRVDLVVYEFEKPKIVFEIKSDINLTHNLEADEVGFHPAVRQAQFFAQELGAPYFAISNGKTFWWFETDRVKGRPVLLSSPVISVTQEHDIIKDSKGLIIQVLWKLSDSVRSHLTPHEQLNFIGLALLARMLAEMGDRTLEKRLALSEAESQNIDTSFNELLYSQVSFPYAQAFMMLDRVELLKIPANAFLDALDSFMLHLLGSNPLSEFKLPTWVTDLMAALLQISPENLVLDMYSNLGDGVEAIGKVQEKARVLSVALNSTSVLWDKLKRAILGLEIHDVLRISSLYEYEKNQYWFAQQPNKIILSPPFNSRIPGEASKRTSDDMLLEVALRWVVPGGRIVVIVPENLLFSKNREPIRQIILEHAWIKAIISLEHIAPRANVKASLLVLERKSSISCDGNVMMSRIQEQHIQDIQQPKNSPLSFRDNTYISKLLYAFENHVNGTSVLNNEVAWFVPFQKLSLTTWAVSNYDPARGHESESLHPTKRLQELVTLRKGSQLTLNENGTLPVIGPGALRSLSIDPKKLDVTSADRLTTHPVRAEINDVLVHAVGPNRGQAAAVGPEFKGYFISRNIIILRVTSPDVLPAYLAIAMNNKFVKQQLDENSTGSVLQQLSIDKLNDILVPVPDIQTQMVIIESVTDAQNKLIEAEQQVLTAELALKAEQTNLQNIINSSWGEGENG
jgi:hypothetical protein